MGDIKTMSQQEFIQNRKAELLSKGRTLLNFGKQPMTKLESGDSVTGVPMASTPKVKSAESVESLRESIRNDPTIPIDTSTTAPKPKIDFPPALKHLVNCDTSFQRPEKVQSLPTLNVSNRRNSSPAKIRNHAFTRQTPRFDDYLIAGAFLLGISSLTAFLTNEWRVIKRVVILVAQFYGLGF